MEKNYHKAYYHLERSHWWFKARLEILDSLLKKKIIKSNLSNLNILNAGIATGATTTMLEKYGNVTSLEYDKDCCDFLKDVVKMDVVNGSLTELPFEDACFDLVCAFDVIEHIEDDKLAAKEIMRVLKDEGYFYLTVPAYNFLWSQHDEINHHYRRYTLDNLYKVFEEGQITPIFKTYFNFFLFPPILAARITSRLRDKLSGKQVQQSAGSDFKIFNENDALNRLLFRLFKSENFFLKRNISFPFGVSILIIGVKSPDRTTVM